MTLQWEQASSGQIIIEQNADWLVRAFGLLFLLPAGYLAYHLLYAALDYGTALLHGNFSVVSDLVVSLPGLFVTVVMLCAFALPAWMLIFARNRAVLDPAQRSVITTRDFRIFSSSQPHSADAFDLVELALDDKSRSRSVLFHLTLLGPRNARLDLAVVDDRAIAQALTLCQQVADLFNLKRRERLAGWRADSPPLTLYPWEAAFWRRLARSIHRDLSRAAALVTGRKRITWQMLNPWPSRDIPPVALGQVQWAFTGAPFRTQTAFNKAVRAFQVEHGGSTDDWEPGRVAVRAPRLVVEYDAPGPLAWVTAEVQLAAGNEQFFTNGDLLFQLHNAVVARLQATDLVDLQGLELVSAADGASTPRYRLVCRPA